VRLRRRRRSPEIASALASFRAVSGEIDRARRALTEATPTTRAPGRPLPDVLLEFEDGLRAASKDMESWRIAGVEDEWRACSAAIARALAVAERLRVEAPPIVGYEALVGALGDLLATLDPFEDALQALRSRR
jgi:hypothetical protein